MPRKQVHLVCNAHLDPVWLWTWQEGLTETLATFRIAADFCEAHAHFLFNHNESLLYGWVRRYDPPLFQRIQRLVREGRWHIAGGAYLQPDVNHPCGESLIRQYLYGLDFFAEHFDARPTVAYNFDPFGHPEGLPQVLAGCGMTAYVFCRPGAATLELPRGAFVWVDRDGSSVLARRSDDHYLTRPGQGGIENDQNVGNKLRNFVEHYREEPVSMILWGIGNHGGGPSEQDWQHLEAVRDEFAEIELIHSTPERFFDALVASLGGDFPPWHGEIERSFPGCYTSMSRVKRAHRRAEVDVLRVESLAALAWWCDGFEYPAAEIDEAWREVLFAEFHDILPGSAIEPAELHALQSLGGTIDRLTRLRTDLLLRLLRGEAPAADGESPVFVHNPHAHAVHRVVEFEAYTGHHPPKNAEVVVRRDGAEIPHQLVRPEHNVFNTMLIRCAVPMRLKSFEIARLDVRFVESEPIEVTPRQRPTSSDLTLEAGGRRFAIDPDTGFVNRIEIDGRDGSFVSGEAFRPVLFRDLDHAWIAGDPEQQTEAGWFDYVGQWDGPCEAFRLATPTEVERLSPMPRGPQTEQGRATAPPLCITEDGPLRKTIEGVFVCGPSSCWRQYIFDQVDGRFEIRDRYFMNHRDRMLKLEVPLGFDPVQSISESLFSAAARQPTAKHEDRHHQRWTSVLDAEGASLGVVNDGSFAHSLTREFLALNVLRSPPYASFGLRPDLRHHAQRFTPRQDQGEHCVSFLIEPTAAFDEAELRQQANDLNAPPTHISFFPDPDNNAPRCRVAMAEPSVFRVEPASVAVTAIKKAQRGDELVLRLHETAGDDTTCVLTINDVSYRGIHLHPFSVKTVRLTNRDGEWTTSNHVES